MTTIGAPRDRAHSAPEWRAYVRETCVEIIREARAQGLAWMWRNSARLWAPKGKIVPDLVGYLTKGMLRGELVAFEIQQRGDHHLRAWALEVHDSNGHTGIVFSTEDVLDLLRELVECPFTGKQLRTPVK